MNRLQKSINFGNYCAFPISLAKKRFFDNSRERESMKKTNL